MTTIITIVVVALVFFVTVCVVAFMIWKRETEMRTDSLRAIEESLHGVLSELVEDKRALADRTVQPKNRYETVFPNAANTYFRIDDNNIWDKPREKKHDPFSWVKSRMDKVRDDAVSEENLKIFRPLDRTSRNVEWIDVTEPFSERNVTETKNVTITNNKDKTDISEHPGETAEVAAVPEAVQAIEEPFEEKIPKSDILEDAGEDEASGEGFYEDTDDDLFEMIEAIELPEYEVGNELDGSCQFGFTEKRSTGYDVGKSGRKYTVMELEELIKE